jgi:hypothetical protein
MSYKKHELLILIEYQNSLSVFGEVCLAQFFLVPLLFFVLFVFVLCFVSYATCVSGMPIHDCPSVFSNMLAKVYKKNNQSNFQNQVHVHALSRRRLLTITKRLVSLQFCVFVLFCGVFIWTVRLILQYYIAQLCQVFGFC